MSDARSFEEGARIDGQKKTIARTAKFGENVVITGKEVIIEDNVIIGHDTTISADFIHVGFGSKIEENSKIILNGANTKFSIGDNCLFGHDNKIIVPSFEAGDFVTLHNHTFVNGSNPIKIGSNVWIGQNCILNSVEPLTIGNGVGIGTYSCVWTHGGHGELLEGCLIFKKAPVTIEDDVWIVGSYNVISPGVTLGTKSVILTGSVVTKNVPPRACFAGNPAKDISDKVPTYKEITLEEKYEMMKGFERDFVNVFYEKTARETENGWRFNEGEKNYEIVFLEEANDMNVQEDESTKLVFTKKNALTKNLSKITIFDLETKTYTKRRTDLEIKAIKFLLYSKARFLPA